MTSGGDIPRMEKALRGAAAENLASLLGSIDRTDEAIALREKVFEHVRGRFPADERAEELYRESGLCEHLQPAARFLQHLWAFFDAVLDCERGLVSTIHHDGVMGRHPHV